MLATCPAMPCLLLRSLHSSKLTQKMISKIGNQRLHNICQICGSHYDYRSQTGSSLWSGKARKNLGRMTSPTRAPWSNSVSTRRQCDKWIWDLNQKVSVLGIVLPLTSHVALDHWLISVPQFPNLSHENNISAWPFSLTCLQDSDKIKWTKAFPKL